MDDGGSFWCIFCLILMCAWRRNGQIKENHVNFVKSHKKLRVLTGTHLYIHSEFRYIEYRMQRRECGHLAVHLSRIKTIGEDGYINYYSHVHNFFLYCCCFKHTHTPDNTQRQREIFAIVKDNTFIGIIIVCLEI